MIQNTQDNAGEGYAVLGGCCIARTCTPGGAGYFVWNCGIGVVYFLGENPQVGVKKADIQLL